jgi:hypothetical protein
LLKVAPSKKDDVYVNCVSSNICLSMYLQFIKGLKASSKVPSIILSFASLFKLPTQLTKGYFNTVVLFTPKEAS